MPPCSDAALTRRIPLTRGLFALVDAADYDWLSQWKWRAHPSSSPGRYYAVRRDYDGGRRGRKPLCVRMHRLILGLGNEDEPDHKNRDTLDNRRENLRRATSSQNAVNRDYSWRQRDIPYRGVYRRQNGRWTATLRCAGKLHCLGTYELAEEAARAFDAAAVRLHGEFAVLNFPQDARV